MNLKIYAVRDAQVEAFLQPFFSPTMGSAIRSLSEAVNENGHNFNKNANDYSLWYLGDFDDASGVVSPPDGGLPKHVIACGELIKTAS